MLSETFYIVCRNCGAWTWDMRVHDFPVPRVEGNPAVLDWKARHLLCGGPLELCGGDGCFDYVAESDEKVLDLNPEVYSC